MRIGLTSTTINGKIDGIGTYTKNLYDIYQKQGKTIVPIAFKNKQSLTSAHPNGLLLNTSYALSTVISVFTGFSIHQPLKKQIDILHSTDHMVPKIKDVPIVATICDAIMFKHSDWHWK